MRGAVTAAHAFAGGLEPRDVVDAIVGRGGARPIAPALAAAVAQPEDAGLDIGRIVGRAGHRLELATDDDRALDGSVVSDRARIEAARHLGVGDEPAAPHGLAEVGVPGDPIVDGAWGYGEERRQLVVGRAEQAVIVRLLAQR
jgi:hypothetical protein